MGLVRVPTDQAAKVVAFMTIIFLLFRYLVDLLLEFSNILGSLPLLLLASLAKSMGGGGITLAFLVSDLRRSLHVHRYLNRTLFGIHCHHAIRPLCR